MACAYVNSFFFSLLYGLKVRKDRLLKPRVANVCCVVISRICTRGVFAPTRVEHCCRYQEPLLSCQEIFRQSFLVICLLLCQETVEVMWKELSSEVDYAEAPAAGLFLSMCIFLCET